MSNEAVYGESPKVNEANETTTTPPVEQSERGWFDFMKSKKPDEGTKCDDEDAAISSEFDQKVHVSDPEPKLAEEENKHETSFLKTSEPEPKADHEEKPYETLFQKMSEAEPKAEENKHENLLQKMHDSHISSSSGSSSDEDGEKKKKKKKMEKKSMTTQIKEKIEERKEKKEEEEVEKHEDDTHVPVENYEEVAAPPHISSEVAHPIVTPEQPHTSEVAHPIATPEPEEKKGFMEKLKEKLPGGHKKAEEEEHSHSAPPLSTPAVETYDGDEKEKKGIFKKIKEKIPGYHSKSEGEMVKGSD